MTHGHDHSQEFLHIQTMVLELERLVQHGDRFNHKIHAMQPRYWKGRIGAVLATSAISEDMTARASVLLMKLEVIAQTLRSGK